VEAVNENRNTFNRKPEFMEVRALTKNVRISPEKARHVTRLIQGKRVVEALAIVELSPRKAAALLGDTLRSAVANAENNHDLKRQDLTVKVATASPGPIIKRFRPKARGSAGRIRKRTSHFEVVLSD
jgi:large subunit ribosomal protein L22